TPEILEPLALTLEKSHFQLADLETKSSEFVFKYQSQKDERWHNFQESISKLTKNAPIYLGDFLLFLLFWVALFKLLPRAPWIEANEARFWPVVLISLALAWFAWFRVSRAIAIVPSLLLMYIATMIRTDPDMKAVLEISGEKGERVRRRL